mmetsp:Transcript_8256/g.24826  ORF Transcript_8256/g.24826 Transcript_8256/m.24826 type:complete len:771 (+) Transcript_8256:72-2384(+)|eukprot:CAMPEP_0198733594 /NCGR_PEP_ID=MMETSP1475-20131203/46796_1 /TAXON_ID= ORGANISM="Unidentified sp., Strain CCMP1999" /NCGR_SAMPLE_ID=MMETSP1475 /ASSEMBLY_ACC=CAM_ASM_001111 /LENGTH=770 /DNA_ID=CAMNT_0044496917 /DNA_START=27 /DNA_END=2339 /DNA_ORIENTATION=+
MGENDMLQLVSYDEKFNEEVEQFWRDRGYDRDEEKFRTVAIMGPQSSGKSTIMNKMFSTKFRTMDESQGRYQVTQGVWMGIEEKARTIVVDLEGTDSRERGEDALVFERKSALFALALSEVLIVNLWTQDIGRLNASNLLLLRTVLEQDLHLFHSGEDSDTRSPLMKTMLFFLLRDYDKATPLERLGELLRVDLDRIWSEITETTKHKGTPISDFFDFDFFGLSHKILLPQEFEEGCEQLRKKFHNEGETLYQESYSRDISTDGFPVFARQVWEIIRSEKELDLPAQKELVAIVRCDEFRRMATEKAEEQFQELKDKLKSEDVSSLDDFAHKLEEICRTAEEEYSERAARYPDKAEAKHAELMTILHDAAISLYNIYAAEISRQQIEKSTKAAKNLTDHKNFGKQLEEIVLSSLGAFDKIRPSEDSFLTEFFVPKRQRLNTNITGIAERTRDQAIRKNIESLKSSFGEAILPPCSSILDRSGRNINNAWAEMSEIICSKYVDVREEAKVRFGPEGMNLDEAALENAMSTLRKQCEAETEAQFHSLLGSPALFSTRIKQCFYDLFRNDERGLPRVWGPDDDVVEIYDQAVEAATSLAGELSSIRLRNLDNFEMEREPVVHFDEEQTQEIKEMLETEAKAAYAESKRSQESMKAQMMGVQGKLPVWLVAALILLGFDDAVWMLRNPALMMVTMVVSVVCYLGYVLNLHVVLREKTRRDIQSIMRRTRRYLDQLDPNDGKNTATDPTGARTSAGKSALTGSSVTSGSAATAQH